ncbi:ubiquitin carboxyl-terminal hydrolase 13-like [Dorcoceras hygrometricum]|uniref:Ubiquitin carboxyl-terminal hydrolase 13-like n=1 Tax=Dorcoceras hygrometricum TaxID=472368 RepID=A0A2Z7A291_9LAMI|nr:ubiquitin carboxyl-terminal hydrolase 13-like [Dorcoceras hygrometricum]
MHNRSQELHIKSRPTTKAHGWESYTPTSNHPTQQLNRKLNNKALMSMTGISIPSLVCTRKPTKISRTESPRQDGITDSASKNQLIMVSVQYGPFNSNILIRSMTIGKSRVARDPIAMYTSWRSNSDIEYVTREPESRRQLKADQRQIQLINGGHEVCEYMGATHSSQHTALDSKHSSTYCFPTHEVWELPSPLIVANRSQQGDEDKMSNTEHIQRCKAYTAASIITHDQSKAVKQAHISTSSLLSYNYHKTIPSNTDLRPTKPNIDTSSGTVAQKLRIGSYELNQICPTILTQQKALNEAQGYPAGRGADPARGAPIGG